MLTFIIKMNIIIITSFIKNITQKYIVFLCNMTIKILCKDFLSDCGINIKKGSLYNKQTCIPIT